MAGRPAMVRSGGLTSLHIGLIAFVVVSVASLGGFIFQLTKVKDAEQRAANNQRRLDDLGTPPGVLGSYYADEARSRNTTVTSVMTDDISTMAELITGTKGNYGQTVETQANELLNQIAETKAGVINPNDTLLTAIRKLDERLTQESNTNRNLSNELASKESQVESLTQDLKSTRDLYTDQVAELKTQTQQNEEDFANKLAAKETQLTELTNELEVKEQQLQQYIREGDTEKRELDLTIARLTRQIGDLQKKIQDLKPGSFDPEAILTKADGRVLRAIPGSDVIYVNLGTEDDIKVGMGFEIYSQTRSAARSLRGKASVEVVTLSENTAECRVIRTAAGQPIIEGDIVVNIAYERSRKPKFVIRGDFDINYDGLVDFDGPDKIRGIIRQWGGQVVSELDETVDYVVIGIAPRVPDVAADASDVVRDQAERKLLQLSEFRRMIDRAQAMYIPVITQTQFLFLTGYAGDGIVRER
ncbi:MAG: hypothetical protein ABIG44_01280 [Planctomycetota bacterium]